MAAATWLMVPGSVVRGMRALDPSTVQLVVADPFATGRGAEEADRLVADSARTVLEQAAHGVRLLPVTSLGYRGRLGELAPAQLTFLTGLPGVQRYDLVPEDVDHDGAIAPDEFAHHVDVESQADAARLDWLLRDRFDVGSIFDGPVSIGVPSTPFRPAPIRGAG
jgi:hypothetical protein